MDEIPDLTSEFSSDEEDFPEGDMYPLSSKRLKAVWIRRLAEALELPTNASVEETRQMIEGKLIQQQYQPQNVQVIIQGKDDAAAMFLVNENGVIIHIEPHILHAHVTSSPDLARGAPLALDGNQVGSDPSSALLSQLQQAKTRVESLETELAETAADLVMTKASLAKEKEKTRRLWQKQCEQHLANEEEMDEKVAEIEKLKAELEKLRNPIGYPHLREQLVGISGLMERR